MNSVEQGPLLEQTMLSAGLDYYKPTMAQVELEHSPNDQVTFTLKNRGENLLADYVSPTELQERLDRFKTGWQAQETAYLKTQDRRDGNPLFSEYFLDYLEERCLPDVQVGTDEKTGDLTVTTEGDWPLVTFWETVVMSELNELYFENFIADQGVDIMDIYDEGERRLSEKIEILQNRPDIKFAEFGTRRRFSLRWQDHVVGRLAAECPDNLIGTSNVALAKKYDLMPIGTYAHELPMVYAALAEADGNSPFDGSAQVLHDWEEMYEDNLSTALPDTFGSDVFFSDFTPEQAKHWQSLRHDSGDPFNFGEELIDFYTSLGIDPKTKTIVFSDGLNMDLIVSLADHFKDKINFVFGWGTTLTNDLGIKANNIVMKAMRVNGLDAAKFSDDVGKYTGTAEVIGRYLLAKQLWLQNEPEEDIEP